MRPFEAVADYLLKIGLVNVETFRADDNMNKLVGLCRDLRGVALACSSNDAYNLLFDWLVNVSKNPEQCRITLFSSSLTACRPTVDQYGTVKTGPGTTAILKFIAEFVHNRLGRLGYRHSSSGRRGSTLSRTHRMASYYSRKLQKLSRLTVVS